MKRDLYLILVIVIAAAAVRIVFFLDYQNAAVFPVRPYSDGYFSLLWAKDIASGSLVGTGAFMKWPLYPYFLGGIFALVGESPRAAYFFQYLLGIYTCVLVYMLGRFFGGRPAAFIAGMLCAFYGTFVFYESLLLYPSLSLFLNALLFFALLSVNHQTKLWRVGSLGVLCGLGALAQGHILLFAFPALLLLLKVRTSPLRSVTARLAAFGIGFCCIIGLSFAHNLRAERDPLLVAGNMGINLYLGNNPHTDGVFAYLPELSSANQETMFRDARIYAQTRLGRPLRTSEVSMFWTRRAFSFVKHHPFRWLVLCAKKLLLVFYPQELMHDLEYDNLIQNSRYLRLSADVYTFVIPFGALGIFLGWKKFRRLKLLYLMIASLAVGLSLVVITSRYRVSVMPYLFLFAGYAIAETWRKLCSFDFKALFYFIVILGCGVLMPFGALRIAPGEGQFGEGRVVNRLLADAMLREEAGSYGEALRILSRALELDPDNPKTYFRLGMISFYLNDYDRALRYFNDVTMLDPLAVDAFYNRGFLNNQQKRHSEAIEPLQKAVSLDPGDPKAHFELGIAYKETGDPAKARQSFASALLLMKKWQRAEKEQIALELRRLTSP